MLPGSQAEDDGTTETNNYGYYAMSQLIEKMEVLGAQPEHCEAKIFGGGCMFPNDQDIGARNIEFACDYLEKLSIEITSKDVGLFCSRRIRFFTDSGKVLVKRLRSLHNKQVSQQEIGYGNALSNIDKSSIYDPSQPLIDR